MKIEQRLSKYLNENFMSLADALKFFGLKDIPDVLTLRKLRGDLVQAGKSTQEVNAAYSEIEEAIRKNNGGILPKTTQSRSPEDIANPRTTQMGDDYYKNMDARWKDKEAEMLAPYKTNNVDPTQAGKLANTAKINMEHAGKMYHLAKTPEEQKKWQKEYYDMKTEMERYQKIAQG